MSFVPHVSTDTLTLLILGLCIVTGINLILVIIALSTNGSLQKKVKRWKSIHATADLENIYTETLDAVADLRKQQSDFEKEINHVREDLRRKVDTPVMRRFNAFSEVGSDLSYSVALLDENKDGVVLTSIYARQDSHTYGKPVSSGTSTYPLTQEEEVVITQSGKKERPPVHA